MKKIMYILIIIIILLSGLSVTSATANDCTTELDYDCCSQINLPSDYLTMIVLNAIDSYFITTLSNVPSNYDISNGDYPGWCIQRSVSIERGVLHSAIPYCSYDINLPEIWKDDDWDKVNYVINNKNEADKMDVQDAIWYFINDIQTTRQLAQGLIDDANKNGDCFCPSPGESMIVILDSGQNLNPVVQGVIIEVTIPTRENTGSKRTSGQTPNKNPVADLSAGESYIGFVNEEIEFNGTLSYDNDGYITEWFWNFGDGTSALGEITTHKYSIPGEYNVILIVTDNKGASDSDLTFVVIIESEYSLSELEVSGPTEGYVDIEYLFSIVSSDEDNDKIMYTIDWGDGTINESDFLPDDKKLDIKHKWTEEGNYIIKLIIDDNKSITNAEITIKNDEPNVPEENNIALIFLAILALLILILFLIFVKRRGKM